MHDDKPETACPVCGNVFKELGSHFAEKPNHRPQIGDRAMDTLTGILMGDGSLPDHTKYPKVRIQLTRPQYLTWLQTEYPALFNGVSREQRDDPHSDVYTLTTIPHPKFHEFQSWYQNGDKKFPANLTLNPRIVKHWYCCDGGLSWPGNSDAGASCCLYSVNEDGEFLVKLFEEVGFSPNNHSDHRIYFPRDETPRLLGWMGVAPDGFEYKWEWQDKGRYKTKKTQKPPTPEQLTNLTNQLQHVAGQLQQFTTLADRQQHIQKTITDLEEDHEKEISELQEQYESKMESVKQTARSQGRRQMRDELVRAVYNHPEIDVPQRVLGECLDLSQQQVGNIVRNNSS